MNLIQKEAVAQRADAIYASMVAEQIGVNIAYAAPETLPKIESRQVKAMMEALVHEMNLRLDALAGWEASRKHFNAP